MKKLLLFSLALGISFGAIAQDKAAAKKSTKMVNSKNKIDAPMAPTQPAPIISSDLNLKGTQEVERMYIGKSANIYSVLLEEQRGLDYNNQIGVHSFTFRTDPATYPEALHSGNIITATSTDGGENWADTWMLPGDELGRYPSGVIYNPDGNTDPAQAYAVAVGPVTSGDGWVSNFFASSKINGDDLEVQSIDNDPGFTGSQLVRNGLQVCNDGWAHIVDSKFQDNGSGYSTEMNIAVWNGEFNGTTFDWEVVDVPVDLAMRTDGTTFNFWTFGNAWSTDGTIGYTWLIGVSEALEGESGYSPIVFYSDDSGENWEEIEVDLADNEVMSEYLWATQQFNGPVWPMCSELAGVVDQNNDLQLFTKATGTFSTHVDSIGYTYTNNLDYIFNIEVNADGVQEVMFVDSIMAIDVPDGSEYGLGTIGWGTRLCASRTDDGSAVFAVWTDSEVEAGEENSAPNIKAAGRLANGDFNDFPVTNFTIDDLYAGFYFYINVGQISLLENDYVHIPVTTTVSPAEMGSDDDLAPCTHSFVKGVKYPWVVGLEEMNAVSNITVGQNSPNPFTGATTINLTSDITAPVMIEVTNLMGQTIYTMNAGMINNTMRVELPANNMEAGVYFYTVTIGNESISKKMIVE